MGIDGLCVLFTEQEGYSPLGVLGNTTFYVSINDIHVLYRPPIILYLTARMRLVFAKEYQETLLTS